MVEQIYVLALLISSLFTIIIYFISKVFGISSLEQLGKSELLEIIIGGVIIIFVFQIFLLSSDSYSCYIINLALNENTNCAELPNGYYAEKTKEILLDIFNGLSKNNEAIFEKQSEFSLVYSRQLSVSVSFGSVSEVSSISSVVDVIREILNVVGGVLRKVIGIFSDIARQSTDNKPEQQKNVEEGNNKNKEGPLSGESHFGYNPCAGFYLMYVLLSKLASGGNMIYTALWSQLILFEISTIIIPVFIAMGILMRSFKITRGIGAFLISFAFALVLIGPLSYLFHRIFMNYMENKYSFSPSEIDKQSIITELENSGFKYSTFRYRFLLFEEKYYCNVWTALSNIEDNLKEVNKEMLEFNNPTTPYLLSFASYALLIIEGFSGLAIISISAGLTKLMGVEISPWVLSQIARLRL